MMGEHAEMRLDGTVCEACGEIFDDIIAGAEPPGHPRYCSKACSPVDLQKALRRPLGVMPPRARRAMRHNQERRADAKTRKPFECKACHKLFKSEVGRDHHFGVKHQ